MTEVCCNKMWLAHVLKSKGLGAVSGILLNPVLAAVPVLGSGMGSICAADYYHHVAPHHVAPG